MRRGTLLLAIGIGVALVACEQVTEPIPDVSQPQLAMSAGPVVESVTGSGHHYTMGPGGSYGEPTWRSFSLNARKYGDGSVNGAFQVNNHGQSWFKGVISCFSIDGNTAWLGAIVTSSSEVLEPGDEKRVLRVVDNGEGANAETDRVSGIPALQRTGYETLEAFCQGQPATPRLNDIEAGNIQINN